MQNRNWQLTLSLTRSPIPLLLNSRSALMHVIFNLVSPTVTSLKAAYQNNKEKEEEGKEKKG